MNLKNYYFFLSLAIIFLMQGSFAGTKKLSRQEQLRKTYYEEQRKREAIAKQEALKKKALEKEEFEKQQVQKTEQVSKEQRTEVTKQPQKKPSSQKQPQKVVSRPPSKKRKLSQEQQKQVSKEVKSRWYKCLKSGLVSCTKDIHGFEAIDLEQVGALLGVEGLHGKVNIAKELAVMALTAALARKFGKEGVMASLAVAMSANLLARGVKGGLRESLSKILSLGVGTSLARFGPAFLQKNRLVKGLSGWAATRLISPIYYKVLSNIPGYQSLQKKPRVHPPSEEELRALEYLK